MNKKRFFWFDSETSGTEPQSGHQILSLAIEVEDELNEKIDTLFIKVKLKKSSVVDLDALKVNKLDPYSDEFNQDAFSYQEAFLIVKKFIIKNIDLNSLNIAVAYRAQFDVDFFDKMFSEFNHKFSSMFDKVICPYSLAKKLTKNNKIETEWKYNNDQTKYRACSLVALSKALNTRNLENIDHTALGDVRTMKDTVKIVWKKAYNQSIFENQDLKRFTELQVYPLNKGLK